ncbi:hypothetical protein BU23DRAFT_575590, partial [Bimuria novae-zelandiae CBS 107.79]
MTPARYGIIRGVMSLNKGAIAATAASLEWGSIMRGLFILDLSSHPLPPPRRAYAAPAAAAAAATNTAVAADATTAVGPSGQRIVWGDDDDDDMGWGGFPAGPPSASLSPPAHPSPLASPITFADMAWGFGPFDEEDEDEEEEDEGLASRPPTQGVAATMGGAIGAAAPAGPLATAVAAVPQ